ncbi:hypothetical protein HMF8227_02880 [Saliniradius amylolyticus]|uniref:GTP-binding protein n=1 Tax=Saliniradius amylolyticus TaxID=2183582 RepID=A0A2S2E6R3_9ALTE|nr:DUF465 domain-containing protein [Saliniradius amylolyticus]AWL13328.1 hypothetical protein HMF8227_02880 [Saliniradius amylolyticus]
MPLEKHPLKKEFPGHEALIDKLDGSDDNFSRLMKKYSQLDEEVFDLENKSMAADDARVEELKLERVKLKDELFQLLQKHAN